MPRDAVRRLGPQQFVPGAPEQFVDSGLDQPPHPVGIAVLGELGADSRGKVSQNFASWAETTAAPESPLRSEPIAPCSPRRVCTAVRMAARSASY